MSIIKRYNRVRPVNGGIVLDMKFESKIEKSVGGIVLPEQADVHQQEEIRARVICVDTDYWTAEKPCPVGPGMVVVVRRHAGVDLELGAGAKTPAKKVVKIDDIVCVLDGYILPEPRVS